MESSYDDLLRDVLNRVEQSNQQLKPGTPLADLKEAIEASLRELPPLEFEEFSHVLDSNTDFSDQLIKRAPDIIGWNADQIVEWVEELAKKLN